MMAQLRLLCLLFVWHVVQGTSISNPCTPDAIGQKQFYHPYPLDNGSYVQCDEWGTPMIRQCPAQQVWSPDYVTCVFPSWVTSGPVLVPDSQPGTNGNRNITESSKDMYQYGSNSGLDSGRGPTSSIESQFSLQTYFAAGGAPVIPSNGQGNQQQVQQQQQIQSVSDGKQNNSPSSINANAGKGTSISNPCTPDAIGQKQFYHPYPLDNGSYVQCDEWGTPMIRQCPAQQVWSPDYVTCVFPSWVTSGPVLVPDSQPGTNGHRNITEPSKDMYQYGSNSGLDSGRGPTSSIESQFSLQTYFAAGGAPAIPSYGQGNQQQVQQQQQIQSASDDKQKKLPTSINANAEKGTSISNPCTPDAIGQKQFYHPYPLDNGSYVQCDEWGTPMIRQCPAQQVWSPDYVTCVFPSWVTSGPVLVPDSQPGTNGHRNITEPSKDMYQYGSNSGLDSGRGPTSSIESQFSLQTYFAAGGAPVIPSNGQGNQQQVQQQQQIQSASYDKQKQTNFPSSINANAGNSDNSWMRHQVTFTSTANNNVPLQFSASDLSQQNAAESVHGKHSGITEVVVPMQLFNSSQFGYYSSNWMARVMGSSQIGSGVGPISNMSSSPCAGQTSPQTSGTPVTLPFPGDTSKYIICYDSNRFEMKSCPSGQRWAAQSHQCVASDPSVATVPPAESDGHNQIRSEICTTSQPGSPSSFYHPYPQDPSRFIQCDQLGNAYLRSCGPSKIWRDELKTCITEQPFLSFSASPSQLANNVTNALKKVDPPKNL